MIINEKLFTTKSIYPKIKESKLKNKKEILGRTKHKNPKTSKAGKTGTTNIFVIKNDKET